MCLPKFYNFKISTLSQKNIFWDLSKKVIISKEARTLLQRSQIIEYSNDYHDAHLAAELLEFAGDAGALLLVALVPAVVVAVALLGLVDAEVVAAPVVGVLTRAVV